MINYLELIIDFLINHQHPLQEFQVFRELLVYQHQRIVLLNRKLLEAILVQV